MTKQSEAIAEGRLITTNLEIRGQEETAVDKECDWVEDMLALQSLREKYGRYV